MLRTLVAALLLQATPAMAEEPLPQSGIRLLLNDPRQFDKPQDACVTKVCRDALRLIEKAETSIDFAFYGMRNQTTLFNALVAAKERGVVVRGVVDKDHNGNSYYTDTVPLIMAVGDVKDDYEHDRREAAKRKPYDRDYEKCERPFGFEGPLQCLGYNIGGRCVVSAHASREPLTFSGLIMHNKFIVIDGRYVWTGSTNLSDSGTGGYNANLSVTIDSKELAGWYIQEFNQMYSGVFHHDKEAVNVRKHTTLADGTGVELYFTPQDDPVEAAIRPLLQQADERIDIAVFFLTHKFITKDLIDAHLRGVKVRVILDASGAKNGYSKHMILRAAGIPVKVETWGGKMHAKSAVIDGQHLIMGSMNWTSAGERDNDENTLILHSKRLSAKYTGWYDELWGSIDKRWLTENPDPESKASGTACTDGVDNDHDHDADLDDRGCAADAPPLLGLPPVMVVEMGQGHALVKGVKDEAGRQVYVEYGTPGYDDAWIDESAGEQWFCSEMEAKAAGWKRNY